MSARITCPHCGQDLRLPDRLRDGPAQCPYCEGAFAVRWQRQKEKPPEADPSRLSPNSDSEGRVPCRFCRQPILPGAVKCRWCGNWLDERG